jgi:hypothetical protein
VNTYRLTSKNFLLMFDDILPPLVLNFRKSVSFDFAIFLRAVLLVSFISLLLSNNNPGVLISFILGQCLLQRLLIGI